MQRTGCSRPDIFAQNRFLVLWAWACFVVRLPCCGLPLAPARPLFGDATAISGRAVLFRGARCYFGACGAISGCAVLFRGVNRRASPAGRARVGGHGGARRAARLSLLLHQDGGGGAPTRVPTVLSLPPSPTVAPTRVPTVHSLPPSATVVGSVGKTGRGGGRCAPRPRHPSLPRSRDFSGHVTLSRSRYAFSVTLRFLGHVTLSRSRYAFSVT